MAALIDMTGRRYGAWLVQERNPENIQTGAAWICLCDCGTLAIVRGSDLRNGSSTNCGCVRAAKTGALNRGKTGAEHPMWRGDDIEYRAAHSRVIARRGVASQHACVGCRGRAHDWAYRGGCPRERVSMREGKGCKYSPDPAMYDPMCQSCHHDYDERGSRRDERGRYAHRG